MIIHFFKLLDGSHLHFPIRFPIAFFKEFPKICGSMHRRTTTLTVHSVSTIMHVTGMNIVYKSRRNLAFSGWVSHNTHVLYLEITCRNDVTNLWLSFSIPTKNCVKAQTDPYSKFIYPYIAICKVSLKTVSEECLQVRLYNLFSFIPIKVSILIASFLVSISV